MNEPTTAEQILTERKLYSNNGTELRACRCGRMHDAHSTVGPVSNQERRQQERKRQERDESRV